MLGLMVVSVLRQKLSAPGVWPWRKASIKKGAGGKEGKVPFSLLGACVCDPVCRGWGRGGRRLWPGLQ